MGYRLMDAAFAGAFDAGGEATPSARPRAALRPTPAPPPQIEATPARYGEARQPNWLAMALILLGHAAALWALVSLDIVHIKRLPRAPLIVTLEIEPPPPPERPREIVARVKPAAPPLIAPPPIVTTPQPPPPVAVDRVPAPPVPVIVPVAAPVSAKPVAATVVPPTPLAGRSNSAPKYPIEARRRKWEGTVRLRVLVAADGHVKDISVARSSGHEELDEAALAAVARWKFQPATQNGEQVEAVGYLNIPFELKA